MIPGRAWKEKVYGVNWLEGETLNAGIGQGYVLVTPLQLCTMAARIASGNAVSPRIVRVVGKASPRCGHASLKLSHVPMRRSRPCDRA